MGLALALEIIGSCLVVVYMVAVMFGCEKIAKWTVFVTATEFEMLALGSVMCSLLCAVIVNCCR